MTKVTIEDQVVSDFKEYFRLADNILKGRGTRLRRRTDYLTLVSLVMDHTHWVLETYPVSSEQKASEVRDAT